MLCTFLSGCSDEHKRIGTEKDSRYFDTNTNKFNIPYSTFSKGYEELNSEKISDSYTKQGVLINVYNDTKPASFKGKQRICDFFENNLEKVRRESSRLKITFKIANREVVGNNILDNGYYKIETSSPNQMVNKRYGKFSIVLTQEASEWKFNVDANASSTEREYEEAISIEDKDKDKN
jgi:hypothetical protein